jgi:hypothetical protein
LAFSLGAWKNLAARKGAAVREKTGVCVMTYHKREIDFSLGGEFFLYMAFSPRPCYIS